MRKIFNSEKAQVLVVAIAAIVAIFLLSILILEVGNVIAEKIHMQNIADSAAMEGGLWYARSLNIISVSNKVLAAAFAVKIGYGIKGVVECAPGGPPVMAGCAIAEMEREKFTDTVRKAQDMFAGTGGKGKKGVVDGIDAFPWLISGLVILNGRNNGIITYPVFNVEEKENILTKAVTPDFNLKRSYFSDYVDEIIENITGKVKKDTENKYNDRETEAKLKKKGGFSEVFNIVVKQIDEPLFIDEKGEHTLLVICYRNNSELLSGSKIFKNEEGEEMKPEYISSSMVRIKGGSMKFWDLNGAAYTAKLDKVLLPEIIDADIPLISGAIKESSEFISENVILH